MWASVSRGLRTLWRVFVLLISVVLSVGYSSVVSRKVGAIGWLVVTCVLAFLSVSLSRCGIRNLLLFRSVRVALGKSLRKRLSVLS